MDTLGRADAEAKKKKQQRAQVALGFLWLARDTLFGDPPKNNQSQPKHKLLNKVPRSDVGGLDNKIGVWGT